MKYMCIPLSRPWWFQLQQTLVLQLSKQFHVLPHHAHIFFIVTVVSAKNRPLRFWRFLFRSSGVPAPSLFLTLLTAIFFVCSFPFHLYPGEPQKCFTLLRRQTQRNIFRDTIFHAYLHRFPRMIWTPFSTMTNLEN